MRKRCTKRKEMQAKIGVQVEWNDDLQKEYVQNSYNINMISCNINFSWCYSFLFIMRS